jgi:hypothetical protein
MFSAGTLFCLRVLFIKLLLLPSRFPECHEVIRLSVVIFPHLKEERSQPAHRILQAGTGGRRFFLLTLP